MLHVYQKWLGIMDTVSAAVLLAIGVCVATLANVLIKRAAQATIFRWSKRISHQVHTRVIFIVNIVAMAVSVAIALFFFAEAMTALELSTASRLFEAASAQLSTIVIAGVILVTGIIAAKVVALKVERLDIPNRQFAAMLLEILILTATILTAVENIGLKITAFMEMFRAAVWSTALAVAIIFGISVGFVLKPKIAKLLKEARG